MRCIVAFVLGALLAIPIAVLGLDMLVESVFEHLGAVMLSIASCMIGVLLLWLFRGPIVRTVFKVSKHRFDDLAAPAIRTCRAIARREVNDAASQAEAFTRTLLAYIATTATLRWLIATIIAGIVAFTGLAGASLVWKQNQILTKHGGLLKDQNRLITAQAKTLDEQAADRAELLDAQRLAASFRIAWDQRPTSDVGEGDLPSEPQKRALADGFLMLHPSPRSPLAGSALRGILLRDAIARLPNIMNACRDLPVGAAHIVGATIGRADRLDQMNVHGIFSLSDFSGLKTRGTVAFQGEFRKTIFRDSELESAVFSTADLTGADFSGAWMPQPGRFTNCTLTDVLLAHAAVRRKTWLQDVSSREGCTGFDASRWRIVADENRDDIMRIVAR